MSRARLLCLLSPEGDAAARDLAEHCIAVRDAYDVTVLALRERRAQFEAVGAAFVGWRPSGIFGMGASISTLRRTATRLDPHLVHAHGFAAAAVALGTFPASLARRTVVTFDDALREGELPRRMVERKLPGFVRRAAAVTATYPSLAVNVAQRLNLAETDVAVIPHGVDLGILGAGDAPLVRPPGRDGPVLGWRGALAADRAWEVAVDALARSRATFPNARLHVSGDGRARQFVQAYVRQNGLADAVAFRGAIPAAELFATIDLLLVPISRDAQPHAPLEALAAGVPVVAANVGALADAVRPFEVGWLVDDDAESFARGVADAWPRIDAAWTGAAAQRGLARERYARDAVTRAYRAVYERATG